MTSLARASFLTLLSAAIAAAAPDSTSPIPLREQQAPDDTWVRSPDVEPWWAEEELGRLEREIATRLDLDAHPKVLTLDSEQLTLLESFRFSARVAIADEVRAARAELLAGWEQTLEPDQWVGFNKLPALHGRSAGELKDVLQLTGKQRKGLVKVRKAAQQRLKTWRNTLRDMLRKQAGEVLTQRERARLDTWKRLATQEAQRRRRTEQLLGGEVMAVVEPHVKVILRAQREDTWARFELLQNVDPKKDEAKDAEQLAHFHAARAERNVRVAEAQAALREVSGPVETARLVGLGLLPE